jgi:hypothetical protein
MKILLNFLPLKSGGGLQVALDFILQAKRLGSAHQWYLVATKGTPFEGIEPSHNFKTVGLVDNELPARLWFEHVGCRRLVREIEPDIIYTQFGPHWPGVGGPHIVGCAYPILVYPEMDFWANYSFWERAVLRLKNWARAKRLRTADEIIFETPVMRDRMVRFLGLDNSRLHVVSPAPSSLVRPGIRHSETAARCQDLPTGYRVLLISGFQKHKNVSLLPRIAEILKNTHGMEDIRFITTLPKEHAGTRAYLADAEQRGVSEMVFNFGPVPEIGCAELYSCVDAVILPSAIESFSNTIAESWSMEKPLIISDLDWARSACGKGAVYMDYNNPRNAAERIKTLRREPGVAEQAIAGGKALLKTYPSSEQRFLDYLRIMEARLHRETSNVGPLGLPEAVRAGATHEI